MEYPVFSHIPDLLRRNSAAHAGAAALYQEDGTAISYADLGVLTARLACDLHAAGVKRDERVALVVPNGRDMSIALLGVCSTAIAAPLNPAYREQEFADYFREIRVKHLVVRRGDPSPARVAAAKMGIAVLELAQGGESILREGRELRASGGVEMPGDPLPDDTALVLLTSGSTGRSKKVPLTHRNICTSVADVARTLELTPADRCLCMWEQFHIGGLVDLLLVPLATGGSVVCTGGFDAGRFYDLLRSASPTWYQCVPATAHELMAYARKHGLRGPAGRLRAVRVTASALAPTLMAELENFFRAPVITTFGMTEAAPLITTNLLPPRVRKPGSTGPSCGPELAITDANGALLPSGEVGEVVVRGANVFAGYEDAPEANRFSFRNGWFRTGDTGYLDTDGYLFLKGRIKETINRGGEKISPQEIDDVLLTHPDVAEAVTFQVPHAVLGEEVAAAVVARRPGALSELEVREFVAARLAEFKVPRKIVFVGGFERNASGKVNRAKLAELLVPDTYEEPSTMMEKTIAAIWKNELGVERVGATDSFTDLGGSSLSGVRLILEIEKNLGGRLPVRALYRLSTVREMAAIIESADSDQRETGGPESEPETNKLSFDDYRAMLAVMGGGSTPVWRPGSIVKVANLGGCRPAVFWAFNSPDKEMSALSAALGPDQPLYGLYSGSTVVDPGKLTALAEHYAKEIHAIQPAGPLVVAGNCRGGRLAIRVATRLRQLGREVSHLCVLEMFERAAYDFDGKLLFIFGKQSSEFRYRDFCYGGIGWKRPFRRPPRIAWIKGRHAAYFKPANVGGLASTLRDFLDGKPAQVSLASRLQERALLLLHRFPPLFRSYAQLTDPA